MIVIGVDVHKRTHTLVAVDESTGASRGERTVAATGAGHLEAIRFARAFGESVVWAIEDCRHVSGGLEQALLAAGDRVIRVSAGVMGASGRGQREPGKSDPIDARAVARAVVRDGVDRFPLAFLDETAMEIPTDHREQLVAERTRLQNRLRTHLLAFDPELEARVRSRSLDQAAVQTRLRARLARLEQSARVRVARSQLAQIVQLTREIDALHSELEALTTAQNPRPPAEDGCGPVTAAILIGQTAGAERFATDARFARASPASNSALDRRRAAMRGG